MRVPSCFFPVLHPTHSSEGQVQGPCPPRGLWVPRPLPLKVGVGVNVRKSGGGGRGALPTPPGRQAWLALQAGEWGGGGHPLEVTESGVHRRLLDPGPATGGALCLGSCPAPLGPAPPPPGPAHASPLREGWAGPAERRAARRPRCSTRCLGAAAARRRVGGLPPLAPRFRALLAGHPGPS